MPTKISWVRNPDGSQGETWNPVRGCRPIAEGCRNCYAAAFASRFSKPGMPYEGLAKDGKWTGRIKLIEDIIEKPLSWKKPRMIFVNSMSDFFQDYVPLDFVDAVLNIIAATPRHTYVILTKRPYNIDHKIYDTSKGNLIRTLGPGDFLPNLWLGVSVSTQYDADRLIPALLKVPAARKIVSVEPQLESIKLDSIISKNGYINSLTNGISWIICGAESGSKKRPFNEDWARSLRDQCIGSKIPCFYKQNSVEEMPRLDGKVWDEIPDRGDVLSIMEDVRKELADDGVKVNADRWIESTHDGDE